MAGYPVLLAQVKYGPRDIPQFGLKGLKSFVYCQQFSACLSHVRYDTCGIIVSRERRACRPITAISTPSITILPADGSMIRNRPRVRDDLPAPVRPTIPTCTVKKSKVKATK